MAQTNYPQNQVASVAGRRSTTIGRVIKMMNSVPQQKQLDNFTVNSTVAAGTVLTSVLDNIAVSITVADPGGGITLETMRDQWVLAFQSEPALSGRYNIVNVGVDGFNLIAFNAGVGWTVDSVPASLTYIQTAPSADALPVPIGRLIVRTDLSATVQGTLGQPKGSLADASLLLARADVLTLTYEAGIIATVSIVSDGETYTASHAMAVDAPTSVGVLAAQLTAALPALAQIGVVANGSDLEITSSLAGKSFEVGFGFSAPVTTAAWSYATNKSNPRTDINRVAAGVSDYSDTQSKPLPQYPGVRDDAAFQYAPNQVMNVLQGESDVLSEDVPSVSGRVFVRLADAGSGAPIAAFRATPAIGCVQLLGAFFVQPTGSGLAKLNYMEPGIRG